MKRHASAEWTGDVTKGSGRLTSQSGGLANLPYSYRMRFENEQGTNPEELIGAAHAGCFTMALSGELTKMGFTPARLHTVAVVSLDKTDTGGWTISGIDLQTMGEVPRCSREQFLQAAASAKDNCPVSRLLRAPISLHAELLEPKQSAA